MNEKRMCFDQDVCCCPNLLDYDCPDKCLYYKCNGESQDEIDLWIATRYTEVDNEVK